MHEQRVDFDFDRKHFSMGHAILFLRNNTNDTIKEMLNNQTFLLRDRMLSDEELLSQTPPTIILA